MFEKIAEELRTARENAGLSKEEVAKKIRTEVQLLQKMESGDFTFMAEVYVKAFLRDFAKTVDLDPETMMKKFKAAKEGRDFEFIPQQEKTPERPTQRVYSIDDAGVQPSMPEPQRASLDFRQILLIGAMVLVVIVVAGYYLFFRENTDIIVTERPVETALQENEKERFEAVIPPAQNVPADSLVLTFLSGSTPCWISVTLDESASAKRETFLQPNSVYTLKAQKSFTVIMGDKSGIQLKLNDKPLSFSTEAKRVNLYIDSVQVKVL